MKALLRKNKAIASAYHGLRLLRNLRFRKAYLRHEKELLSGSCLDLEKLSELALAPVCWQRETFACNELYSHDLVLKRFLEVDPGLSLKVLVEHGCVFIETLVENTLNNPLARQNLVMSRARANFLAGRGIPATPIGPYIHYAQPLLDQGQMRKLKKSLGKTLLFFPCHSTLDISLQDSYCELDSLLSRLQKDHAFDSVLICGYYLDIDRGLFKQIEKREGYYFVSCGHRLGPVFQQLLKTYLLLSDVVASNATGTQTGYALYLGKPFWVSGAQHTAAYYKGEAKKLAEELRANSRPILSPYGALSLIEFENLFRKEELSMAPGTLKLVSDLWGFEDVVSKKEMYQAVF